MHRREGPGLSQMIKGRDDTVPELSCYIPYDPFKVDIYILGNIFRETIYDVWYSSLHCKLISYEFLAIQRRRILVTPDQQYSTACASSRESRLCLPSSRRVAEARQ